MKSSEKLIALLDQDGTLADYSKALFEGLELLRGPAEETYSVNFDEKEPPHIKERMKLIKTQPGWWRNLEPLPLGFKIVDLLRKYNFQLRLLTKGPSSNSPAWMEKVDWARHYLPDALITITEDKSNSYGKILVDDHIPYVEGWLKHRPRGLAIMPEQPWNIGFQHPNAIHARENNLHEVEIAIVNLIEKSRGSKQTQKT